MREARPRPLLRRRRAVRGLPDRVASARPDHHAPGRGEPAIRALLRLEALDGAHDDQPQRPGRALGGRERRVRPARISVDAGRATATTWSRSRRSRSTARTAPTAARSRSARSRRALRWPTNGAPDHPLHGQGRSRQDERGGCHGAPLRGRGNAHDRDLDRPRAQPVGLARDRSHGRAHAVRHPALGPGGTGPGRDGAPLGGGPGLARRDARRPRRRPDLRRGADRPAGHGRALLAASDQGSPRVRRLRRDHRRLRAHRRDAAAPVLPRRRELVAREGVPVGAARHVGRPAARAHLPRRLASGRSRLRRRRAAGAEPRRDERDPPRSHPRRPSGS